MSKSNELKVTSIIDENDKMEMISNNKENALNVTNINEDNTLGFFVHDKSGKLNILFEYIKFLPYNENLKIFCIFLFSFFISFICNKILNKLYKNFKNKKEVISKKEAQKDNQTLNNENKEQQVSNSQVKDIVNNSNVNAEVLPSYLEDVVFNKKIIKWILFIIPAIMVEMYIIGYAPSHIKLDSDKYSWNNFVYLYQVIWVLIFIKNVLKQNVLHLKKHERYKDKPLDSFSQIIFIIFLVSTLISVYIHYTNQSVVTLFTTLSVVSMATFLTLKDIILGVVSTVLIIINDIVRVGDWIKMSKYNADGKIVEINLITVKVKNFDKTISVIPTYSLISDGFENQQEMVKSGTRRIKRSIRVDIDTIKSLSIEDMQKYKEVKLLKDYVERKEKEYVKAMAICKQENVDTNLIINNNKKVTNLSLYRKYIELKLKENPVIITNKTEDFTVRLIEGNEEGVGIEIYCFSSKNQFGEYEHIQSSLFENIYADAEYFDLMVNS
mgnify:CR=1 FL=1